MTAAGDGLALFDPSRAAPDTTFKEQLDSVRTQLAAEVPAGSRIFVAALPPDPVWTQRIVEVAMIDGILVVDDDRGADFKIFVSSSSTARMRLAVERIR